MKFKVEIEFNLKLYYRIKLGIHDYVIVNGWEAVKEVLQSDHFLNRTESRSPSKVMGTVKGMMKMECCIMA